MRQRTIGSDFRYDITKQPYCAELSNRPSEPYLGVRPLAQVLLWLHGQPGGSSFQAGGSRCGFGTFSAWAPRAHPEIMWAKFRSMVEGARIASERLWGSHLRVRQSETVKVDATRWSAFPVLLLSNLRYVPLAGSRWPRASQLGRCRPEFSASLKGASSPILSAE